LQLRLYSEVIDITSMISVQMMEAEWAPEKRPALDDSIAKFWVLYWGRLAMVEDKEVSRKKHDFGNLLNEVESLPAEPADQAASGQPQLTRLQYDDLRRAQIERVQQASLKLAEAVRASLDQSWGINVWTSKE
jgi:hypothetical protein